MWRSGSLESRYTSLPGFVSVVFFVAAGLPTLDKPVPGSEQSGCAGGGREVRMRLGAKSRGIRTPGMLLALQLNAVFFLTLPMTLSTIKSNLTRSTPSKYRVRGGNIGSGC